MGLITGDKLAANTVTADKLAANILKTANYAYTGTEGGASEVATAGAKMQNAPGGTALLVAPGNLKIGDYYLSGCGRILSTATVKCQGNGSVYLMGSALDASVAIVDRGATNPPQYVIRVTCSASLSGGFTDAVVVVGPCHEDRTVASGGPTQDTALVIPKLIMPGTTNGATFNVGLMNPSTGAWLNPNSVAASFSFIRLCGF